MKKILASMLALQSLLLSSAYAGAVIDKDMALRPASSSIKDSFSEMNLSGIYSYTDFNFNSTKGYNFNRYNGHSNLYALAGDNVVLSPSWTTGLAILKVDTGLISQASFSPGSYVRLRQSINNYSLFAHVRRQLNAVLSLDLSGVYGHNKVSSESQLNPYTTSPQYGTAHTNNDNWLASFAGMYNQSFGRFIVNANVRALYSQINAGSYYFNYPSGLSPQLVPALTNKVTFIMENAELGYQIDPFVAPFINAGLVQVAHFSNSRVLIDPTIINGTLPQLNMNRNGYRLGGGVSFDRRQWTLRIEEQYYNAGGGLFKSYQTLVGLKYQFV